jgi:hypothetical protein
VTVEVPLLGGTANRGRVHRVGDTVRRPLRPTSGATHALLRHLEEVGFDGAPRVLGVDDAGREVLSYVPGQAVTAPAPAWGLTDDALRSVGRLLRRFHDATAAFDPAPYRWSHAAPAPFDGHGIAHNDPNLDNVVFRDGRAVALIDFDLAGPGSPVWDVAAAARLWAPLRDPADVPHARSLDRLRLFLDAYGLPSDQRGRVIDALVEAHEWCYRIVRGALRIGHEPFERMWRDGGEAKAARTRAWLVAHDDEMRNAVIDSAEDPRKSVSNE